MKIAETEPLVVCLCLPALREVLPDLRTARAVFQIFQMISRVLVIAHFTAFYIAYPLNTVFTRNPYQCSRLAVFAAGICGTMWPVSMRRTAVFAGYTARNNRTRVTVFRHDALSAQMPHN